MYPVDLQDVDDSDLTSGAGRYLCSLENKPDDGWFHPSPSLKVLIKRDNVRRLRAFDDDQSDCTLLALHAPDEPTRGNKFVALGMLHMIPALKNFGVKTGRSKNTGLYPKFLFSLLVPVVALYLFGQWWPLDDVLRTSSRSRTGLLPVRSITERVLMFLLSQVVDTPSQEEEEEEEEALFSSHPRTESGKLLWRDGEAVGFYTVKRKGSLCGRFLSRCYSLPVLDTVLVRRRWRRRGLGLHMLEDFCCSFSKEDVLGVSAPLSPGMVAVCRSFLQEHEEHRERLHEVEAPGGWTQQRNIWLSIQLGHYCHSTNKDRSPSAGQTVRNEDDSSQKKPINNWRQGVDSVSTCDTNRLSPLQVDFSEKHIKTCDANLGADSGSRTFSGTGCSPEGRTDRGPPPTKSLKSPHRKQALKYESSESAELHRRQLDPQEMLKSAKRARRTLS